MVFALNAKAKFQRPASRRSLYPLLRQMREHSPRNTAAVNDIAIGTDKVPFNRLIIFCSIAISGLAIDLATKAWIFKVWVPDFRGRKIWWIVENYFGFETALNEGALFGIGQGQSTLFAVLSIAAAIGIVTWLFYFKAAHDWLLTISLGSVTGGIFGNLYDRMGYGYQKADGTPVHAVRDWILFCYYDQYTWPNFNIADALLVCGAALLAYHAFRQPHADQSIATPNKPARATS